VQIDNAAVEARRGRGTIAIHRRAGGSLELPAPVAEASPPADPSRPGPLIPRGAVLGVLAVGGLYWIVKVLRTPFIRSSCASASRRDHVPKHGRLILACNHRSVLDSFFTLWSSLRR